MSEAEQAAFFSQWGSQIEGLLYKGLGAIDQRFERLEFLQECAKPLRAGQLVVLLNQDYTAAELSHLRFLAHIIDVNEPEPHPTLCIAGRDTSGGVFVSGNQSQQLVGLKNLVWSIGPEKIIQNPIIGLGSTTKRLEVYAALRKAPLSTLWEI